MEHLLLRFELSLEVDSGSEEILAEDSYIGSDPSSDDGRCELLEEPHSPALHRAFQPLSLSPSGDDEEDSDHLGLLLTVPPSASIIVPLFVDPLLEEESPPPRPTGVSLSQPPPPLFCPEEINDSEDDEDVEEYDHHAFLSQGADSSLALGKRTRSYLSIKFASLDSRREAIWARRTLASKRPHIFLWHDMADLWSVSPPHPGQQSRYDSVRFYDRTESLGVYLIARGFSIIGEGRHTIVFALSDRYVAKVAKWDIGKGHDELYFKHLEERNRDLAMSRDYPACFARTELVYTYTPGTYRMYVQERLVTPASLMHGLDAEQLKSLPNRYAIQCMCDNNKDVQFKQWGWADRRGARVRCYTAPGIEEELDGGVDALLVGFDYS
jgi:hypothetical protein